MHPYSDLPSEAFWKTAVSEKNFLDFKDVYKPKFPIRRTDRIVTAGSCFAQHIARKLSASGFAYQDYEAAPSDLPEKVRGDYGYGIFSARYGNVYTVRQLLQLFERAYEGRSPGEDVWVHEGRWFDPYRPAIEPNGFASEEEFQAARRTHMAAVRRVFAESEILIFTLGLTEAWRSRIDGSVFPVCPGTVAGSFDAGKHEFHNFGAVEVIADLRLLIEKARGVNPDLRFLLTVSPVPLTATASGQHVMVASSYSKAVLRAAAGEIAGTDDGVDYFPSFELVSAHPVRAALFEPNLRAVSPRGVDLVMRHFFKMHGPGKRPRANGEKRGKRRGRQTREPGPLHQDDVICEEERLEKFIV
jgi:hypothetical protein